MYDKIKNLIYVILVFSIIIGISKQYKNIIKYFEGLTLTEQEYKERQYCYNIEHKYIENRFILTMNDKKNLPIEEENKKINELVQLYVKYKCDQYYFLSKSIY